MRTADDSAGVNSILWRRMDRPGHESCRLQDRHLEWWLEGTAVFMHERKPCRLDYLVHCDTEWRTQRCSVWGWLGTESVDVEVRSEDGRWSLGERECREVEGAVDIDLNFSPSTNLLPIRRLELEVGEEATVRAAWLRFPSFELAPLEQTYRRLDASRYRYESGSGFVADLVTDPMGFVTDYPGLWTIER